MGKKTQRHGNNTASQQSEWIRHAEVPDPPDGVNLSTEEEKTLWAQYTATRTAKDWRPVDLLILAKIVKLEVQMRWEQSELDKEGSIVFNQRGTPVQNPRFNVVSTLQNQQMQLIKSLSLNQTASDPRTLNKQGKQANSIASKVDEVTDEDDGLIAPPVH